MTFSDENISAIAIACFACLGVVAFVIARRSSVPRNDPHDFRRMRRTSPDRYRKIVLNARAISPVFVTSSVILLICGFSIGLGMRHWLLAVISLPGGIALIWISLRWRLWAWRMKLDED